MGISIFTALWHSRRSRDAYSNHIYYRAAPYSGADQNPPTNTQTVPSVGPHLRFTQELFLVCSPLPDQRPNCSACAGQGVSWVTGESDDTKMKMFGVIACVVLGESPSMILFACWQSGRADFGRGVLQGLAARPRTIRLGYPIEAASKATQTGCRLGCHFPDLSGPGGALGAPEATKRERPRVDAPPEAPRSAPAKSGPSRA